MFHFYSLDSPKSLGYCFPQECDTFTCEPASTCHRCTAPRKEFLSAAEFASKSSLERRRDITSAAAGKGIHLRGMREGEPVVDWGKAPDHIHKPGPNAANYERFRESAGAHLVFNAFWKIHTFACTRCSCAKQVKSTTLGTMGRWGGTDTPSVRVGFCATMGQKLKNVAIRSFFLGIPGA